MNNPEPGYYWAYLWRQHYGDTFPDDEMWGEPYIILITHTEGYGYEIQQMGYDLPTDYKPSECKLLRKVVYETP